MAEVAIFSPNSYGAKAAGDMANAAAVIPTRHYELALEITGSISLPTWGYSSVGRTSALQAEGRRFESDYLHHGALVPASSPRTAAKVQLYKIAGMQIKSSVRVAEDFFSCLRNPRGYSANKFRHLVVNT